MDHYLSILRGILSTKGSVLETYLEGLEYHRTFYLQPNESSELVQHISSLLTKSDTRFLGLRLLVAFIDGFSIDIFEKKATLWTTLVLKSFSSHEFHFQSNLVYVVLDKIIKKTKQSPDLSKTFASSYLCKIYENLINEKTTNINCALKCIETCLRLYPSSSGSSRATLERFLWKTVDNNEEDVVISCGKCLHLLQQIKGGGVSGSNFKTQWKNYQVQLIGGIHGIYNELFINCVELYDDKIEAKNLSWDTEKVKYDIEPVKRTAQMYAKCHNLIKCLEIALREPFPVEKPILLRKILNVINRGLSINYNMLEQNPLVDNIALSILLPKLHIDLLELLTVLMTILHGQLRPYSEVVLGLLVDTLKWTSSGNIHGDQKLLQLLRRKVYETISRWCKTFRSGNRISSFAEYLFQEILCDITPIQNEFTMKVLSGVGKNMSKRTRRQLHSIKNGNSNIVLLHSYEGNDRKNVAEERKVEVCISALCCLQSVLFSCTNFIKPTILKPIQVKVTRICTLICEYPPAHFPHLYDNKICRIEIYNTLYAMLTNPHVLCPPPTETVYAILQTAFVRDKSVKVRINCEFILQNLEKLIHPQKESLVFTNDSLNIRNTFIKFGQESLCNEAVVKFPSILPINDVINTNDSEGNGTNNYKHHDDGIESIQAEVTKMLSNSSIHHLNNNESFKGNLSETFDLNNDIGEDIYTSNYPMRDFNEIETYNPEFLDKNITKRDEMSIIALNDIPSKINDIETIAKDAAVTMHTKNIYEPILKKPKLDNANELETNRTVFDVVNIVAAKDEDTIVADIASQFVDELN